MKICIVALGIVPFFDPDAPGSYGGAESQAGFVASALQSRGHDVSFVVANMRPENELPYRAANAFNSGDGVPVARFFHPRMSGTVRALDAVAADVYYQRNAGMITGIVSTFCRRRRKVFVYGAGSDTDLGFASVRVDSLRDRLMYYTGLKLANGIIVQNRTQEELCRRLHPNKPLKMIPNGVIMAGATDDGVRDTVLWMGAIRRVKQPEAFVRIARALPSLNFVLVGPKTGTERAFADGVAREAASVPNLRLAGHLSHPEAIGYLKRALMLVNTSKVEGFPNAYLEAWSAGVPVVSFQDIDGLIETESLGVVCRSVEEMQSVVAELAADDARRSRLGENARNLTRKRFSSEVLAGEYEAFFNERLAGNASDIAGRAGGMV
jgi:glycosyltransferase involved in cell wall biosynthesis